MQSNQHQPSKIKSGDRFGRLTVVEFSHKGTQGYGYRYWKCKCVCGLDAVREERALLRGRTRSCGCVKPSDGFVGTPHPTHGMSHTPEYKAWKNMIQRCTNPRHTRYTDYGGRDISVCLEWRASFGTFYRDVGPKPGPEYSIDRYPDNDGNYEPSNCRWATRKQQQANKRPRRKTNG